MSPARLTYLTALAVSVFVSLFFLNNINKSAVASELLNTYLKLSSSQSGQDNVSYTIGLETPSNSQIGSFVLEFCSNSPLIELPCIAPTDFDASNSTILSQTGITDFYVNPGSTANRIIFSRSSGLVGPTSFTIEIAGIKNPSKIGTHYARFYTYASEDGSGISTDNAAAAFAITDLMALNTRVPPYLIFCSGVNIQGYDCSTMQGDYVDFGDLSSKTTKTGSSQVLVMTNAGDGFNISVSGSGLTSGNNVIKSLNNPTSSIVGQSQFGLNLRANSQPAVGADPVGTGNASIANDYNMPNKFKFNSGDIIALHWGVSTEKKFTISYITNVESGQPAGLYSTTLLYTAYATF